MLASGFIPLMLSFDKNLHFYTRWKFVIPSILFVAIFFIIPDVYLTKFGIWGFNANYHSATIIFGLPLEEILFFIVIPYASLFIHYSLFLYWPQIRLKKSIARAMALIFILASFVIIGLNYSKIYTVYSFALFILALVPGLLDKKNTLGGFFVSFMLILGPFILVDGILTGTFIEQEVVWYNPCEFLGIRLLTIPIEDILYGFSLIYFNLLIIEGLACKMNKNLKSEI